MAEYMFPNVAYRATVYRTGTGPQTKKKKKFKTTSKQVVHLKKKIGQFGLISAVL